MTLSTLHGTLIKKLPKTLHNYYNTTSILLYSQYACSYLYCLLNDWFDFPTRNTWFYYKMSCCFYVINISIFNWCTHFWWFILYIHPYQNWKRLPLSKIGQYLHWTFISILREINKCMTWRGRLFLIF